MTPMYGMIVHTCARLCAGTWPVSANSRLRTRWSDYAGGRRKWVMAVRMADGGRTLAPPARDEGGPVRRAGDVAVDT